MKLPAFSLVGKTVLITGASSGIGRGIAIKCSEMGAKVILHGRRMDRLKETMSLMQGDCHQILTGDLKVQDDLERLVAEIPEIHGWVNSAGIPQVCPIKHFKRNDVEEIFNVNIVSTMLLLSLLLRSKKLRRGASVVLVSALTGAFVGSRGDTAYCASKGAVDGFMKGAALELSSIGIRVNTVNPGLVPTEILDLSNRLSGEEYHTSIMMSKYPLKRLGSPDDIANGAVFLLSNASSWITGHALVIDGGYLLE